MNNCDSSTKYFAITSKVAGSLRCSVCAGQNIASSDSAFALEVRSNICGYAQLGLSETEIMQKISADYGGDLQMATIEMPQMFGLNIALLLLLVVGAIAIKRIISR